MSFAAYLIQPFHTTHENIFFRKVVGELNSRYSNDEYKKVLIGNLSCGGHLLDAIFITSGKIIIIDFKDYEGRLEFSENNPWRIYSNNDFTFVSGGGGIRNPYQQLNAYRFSLMNVLTTKQESILSPNHIDVRWDHINCMVLFHKRIHFNNENIPDRINRFFSVADQTTYKNVLHDRYSNNLQLNDNEIESILRILDVRPENIFDEEDHPQVSITQINDTRGNRLDFVRRHIRDVGELNENQRILEYYRTILNLEKFKESKCTALYRYPIKLDLTVDQFNLNISSNNRFYSEFLQNNQQQFPQNVFIGIDFLAENETITLFQNIILRSDIDNPEDISVRLTDFTVYTKILEEKGLSEDIIDDLISALNQCDSLHEKIETVRNKLEWDIQLENYISIGLSNESPFNSQLLSELRSILRFNNLQEHSLFYSFLRNENIIGPYVDFEFSPLIFITQLNWAQRRAIRLAFSQPLTVITGPPGTGKTQVVLNLIANAIVNKKTILFASKNNKAVDNVKMKLKSLLTESDYVLRFGTKEEVRNKTKPTLQNYLSRIQTRQIEHRTKELVEAKELCHATYEKVKLISNELGMIPKLEKAITETKEKIKIESGEFKKWVDSKTVNIREIIITKSLNIQASVNDLSYYINKLNTYKKNSIGRIFFSLFLKNKYYTILKNLHTSQHPEIQKYIEQTVLIQESNIISLDSYINYLTFVLNLKKEERAIEEKVKSNLEIDNLLAAKLEQLESALKKYKLSEKELRDEFDQIIYRMPQIGLKYLNEFINQKLFETDPVVLSDYIQYIPDNIPWQQQNTPQFILTTQEFLNKFNAVIVTNLSVKNAFPLYHEMFDLVVIDEASQCDVASALPLVLRAKKLIVIGDPLQLTHITNVEKYEEEYVLQQFNLTDKKFNYVENSLYKYCENLTIKSKYESVFLNEHFRSHEDIISFSKRNFYLPKLGQDLIVKTPQELLRFEPLGITWKNVSGQIHRNRNENNLEIEVCLRLAEQLHNNYPTASIGITTPYKHQAEAFRNRLPQNLQGVIIADNVHKYQGDERDIIIFSIVLCHGVPLKKANWINYKVPYLLNVAVTRARSSLIIVGDFNYCKSLTQRGPTPLSQLANYVYSLNRVEDL